MHKRANYTLLSVLSDSSIKWCRCNMPTAPLVTCSWTHPTTKISTISSNKPRTSVTGSHLCIAMHRWFILFICATRNENWESKYHFIINLIMIHYLSTYLRSNHPRTCPIADFLVGVNWFFIRRLWLFEYSILWSGSLQTDVIRSDPIGCDFALRSNSIAPRLRMI